MNTLLAHFTHFTKINSRDPDVQRRGQLLVILMIGMIALILILGIPLILANPTMGRFLNVFIASTIFGVVAWLGRSGRVTPGAYIVIVASMIGSVSGTLINPAAHFNLFFLLISVLLASVLLRSNQIWIVLALNLGALAMVWVMLGSDPRTHAELPNALAILVFLLVLVSFIAYLGSLSTAASLTAAQVARHEAEASEQALAASHAVLEQRVEERTRELRAVVEHQQTDAAALQASLDAQQDLNRMITDLAVPIIPVRHDTLVVPLVGNIDSTRADQILHLVLTRVQSSRIQQVILDVTGVAVVDTQVSAALLRVASATRLMGAKVILAGIRPEVAQSLVGLGVDLRELQTISTLQEALAR